MAEHIIKRYHDTDKYNPEIEFKEGYSIETRIYYIMQPDNMDPFHLEDILTEILDWWSTWTQGDAYIPTKEQILSFKNGVVMSVENFDKTARFVIIRSDDNVLYFKIEDKK